MAMNGLERITYKILAEAKQEAQRILEAAEAEAAQIRADYAARADEIRATLSDEAQREGNSMIARAKAEASNRKRDRMLAVRSRMMDESFDATQMSYRRLPIEKRVPFLSGLLSAALMEELDAQRSRSMLGDEDEEQAACYEVLLSARDRDAVGASVLEEAKKKLVSKIDAEQLDKLVLSERTAAIEGGLILRVGSVEINCSLELLFAQLREELEGEVSHALFQGV